MGKKKNKKNKKKEKEDPKDKKEKLPKEEKKDKKEGPKKAKKKAKEDRDKKDKKARVKEVPGEKEGDFQAFLMENPHYKNPQRLEGFEVLFNFINDPKKIEKMVQEADQARPALGGIVKDLEALHDHQKTQVFDLKDVYTRTCVGRMVTFLLNKRGYDVLGNKAFSKTLGYKYFASASLFEKRK